MSISKLCPVTGFSILEAFLASCTKPCNIQIYTKQKGAEERYVLPEIFGVIHAPNVLDVLYLIQESAQKKVILLLKYL
jgi:hypothetical protein